IATPQLIVTNTEGAKKAGALLSAGCLAIGLPGIWMGVRSKRDGLPSLRYLVPQLEVFCHADREFVFCFDRDEKPKTIADVRKAIDATGKLLQRKGCKVSTITWTQPCKGVDDLIVQMGTAFYFEVFDRRLSLDSWRLADMFSLGHFPQHKVNVRYLSPNDRPAELEGKIICVQSAKGTGKTQWIGDLLAPEIAKGRSVLIITHRIQLARELARRIGVAHISEVRSGDGAVFGYALCIDSLHAKSQANFNPEAWEQSIVVIDECDQVLWHLLDSTTCQNNRVAILQNFERLMRTIAESNGTIILSDADLSRVSIEYVQQLTDRRMALWLMVNKFLPSQGKRQLFLYDSPASLMAKAMLAIANGEKAIFHLSAQKAKSKWSTQNVESMLKKRFPHLRIVRIDAATVADPAHSACGCIDQINDFILQYDIVICSPTVETGISIDVNHFDSVWSIANGVQTVDAVCQAIERVRSDVPRHITIGTGGITFCGNGSDSLKSLVLSQKQNFKANLSALSKVDMLAVSDGFGAGHLNTWGCFAARVNQGFKKYRANILHKLIQDGYELSIAEVDEDFRQVDEDIVAAKVENYNLEIESKIAAENPNDYELELLIQKTSKTKIERDRQAKGIICRKYLTEDIDRDLIIKDDDSWYPQIQLAYYLSVGAKHLKRRDKGRLEGLSEDGRIAFIPDGNRACLSSKIAALKVLKIVQFFGEDKIFTNESLIEWHRYILQFRFQVKDILGVTIGLNSTPIRAAQVLLDKLGYRLDYLDRARIEGVPTRRYGGVQLNCDRRDEVFDRWLVRDEAILEAAIRSTTSIAELNGENYRAAA
uniref:plasmid replication protein, CyRepA1 family n=1 Tax=Chamaesiphon sp. TaxID=2814140 RepID=UPI0035941FDF